MPLLYKVLKSARVREDEMYEVAVKNLVPVSEEKINHETDKEKSKSEDLIRAAREEASQLIKGAQNEKERILKEAKEQAEKLLIEARGKGYQEGLKKGRAEGEKIRQQAEQHLKNVKELHREVLHSLEPEVVELSVKIAEQLIHQQFSLNRETILGIVSAAVKKLSDQSYILIRVNPQEADILKKNRERLKLYLKDQARVEILADSEISRGSCRVESDCGLVKVNLEEGLKEVKSVLKEVLEAGGHKSQLNSRQSDNGQSIREVLEAGVRKN